MKFEIKAVYLGMKPNTLSDGSIYFTCNFFNTETQTPLSLNCGEKSPVVAKLNEMDFGTPCIVSIALIQSKEKSSLYKLSLRSVS